MAHRIPVLDYCPSRPAPVRAHALPVLRRTSATTLTILVLALCPLSIAPSRHVQPGTRRQDPPRPAACCVHPPLS